MENPSHSVGDPKLSLHPEKALGKIGHRARSHLASITRNSARYPFPTGALYSLYYPLF